MKKSSSWSTYQTVVGHDPRVQVCVNPVSVYVINLGPLRGVTFLGYHLEPGEAISFKSPGKPQNWGRLLTEFIEMREQIERRA